MPLELDHVIIAVKDLEAAIQDYHDLGFVVTRGGVHANRATHNALIALRDGTYLELLAPTGEAPVPGLIDFSPLLHRGEGLAGFALRAADLDAEAARLRAGGFAVGEVIPGERRREDGTVIQWKLALLEGTFAPFLIQDLMPREWRVPTNTERVTHPNRAIGLRAVQIVVRNLEAGWNRCGTLFGASPASVVLREVKSIPAETLDGIVLVLEPRVEVHFASEKTHGVRFRPVSPVT